MGKTDRLLEFARRYVEDADFRRLTHEDVQGTLVGYGIHGDLAQSAARVLGGSQIDVQDGLAALRIERREPDSDSWF